MSVNCLYRDRVRDMDRVSGRVTDRVRVKRPDSSGNLLTRHKMEFALILLGLLVPSVELWFLVLLLLYVKN